MMARPKRATKEKEKMGKGKIEKQKKEEANKEKQENRGTGGKRKKKERKRGTQETTGSIRKQQVRVRKREETRGNEIKREETSFAQAISVQTARCWSALPKMISLCVALLRLRKPDHGPQGVECRGRFVQGIMEADFDGSSSAVNEVASSTACSSTQRASSAQEGICQRSCEQ